MEAEAPFGNSQLPWGIDKSETDLLRPKGNRQPGGSPKTQASRGGKGLQSFLPVFLPISAWAGCPLPSRLAGVASPRATGIGPAWEYFHSWALTTGASARRHLGSQSWRLTCFELESRLFQGFTRWLACAPTIHHSYLTSGLDPSPELFLRSSQIRKRFGISFTQPVLQVHRTVILERGFQANGKEPRRRL